MAATPEDPLSIVRSIAADPAALAELRRVVVAEELRELTQQVRTLAEAQERTERRLAALAEAQERTEQRLAALAEAQERTETAIERLATVVSSLSLRFEDLAVSYGHDRGVLIELKYARHGHAYFAPIARRLRLLTSEQLDDILDPAVASGDLQQQEAHQIRLADLVFRGRQHGQEEEVFLVVEASGVINDDDVVRAAWRAELLQRTGVVALPVVAGQNIGHQSRELARLRGVWAVRDGVADPPDAA